VHENVSVITKVHHILSVLFSPIWRHAHAKRHICIFDLAF